MHVHTRSHMHIHTLIHPYMLTHSHTCACSHTFACMRSHMLAHNYILMHIHTYKVCPIPAVPITNLCPCVPSLQLHEHCGVPPDLWGPLLCREGKGTPRVKAACTGNGNGNCRRVGGGGTGDEWVTVTGTTLSIPLNRVTSGPLLSLPQFPFSDQAPLPSWGNPHDI